MGSEITFELSQGLSYAHKGEQRETGFITLREPTYKHIEQCVPLKQAFFRAAADIANAQGEQASGEASNDQMTGNDVVMMFYQSGEDMLKIMLQAVELFKSPGIALAGGEERMTAKLIEDLSGEDLENMFGEYMVNFILASVLSKAGQT